VEAGSSAEAMLNFYIDQKQRRIPREGNFIKDLSQNRKPHLA
jgi:hypothetical protein